MASKRTPTTTGHKGRSPRAPAEPEAELSGDEWVDFWMARVHEVLTDLIKSKGPGSVADTADELGISTNTIRRAKAEKRLELRLLLWVLKMRGVEPARFFDWVAGRRSVADDLTKKHLTDPVSAQARRRWELPDDDDTSTGRGALGKG